MNVYAYGYPRLGRNREFKKAIEGYWNSSKSEKEMIDSILKLERERISLYEENVDKVPIGEMTLYDNILDTALLLGVYNVKDLKEYFELCRGKNALPMRKYFNTNYHYLVPDLRNIDSFSYGWDKVKRFYAKFVNYENVEIWDFKSENPKVTSQKNYLPVYISPFTFIKLSFHNEKDFEKLLESAIKVYKDILIDYNEVILEDPALVLELSEKEVRLVKKLYNELSKVTNVYALTYYDSLEENTFKEIIETGVKGIFLDIVNGKFNLELLRKYKGYINACNKEIILGVTNGRNVWRADLFKIKETLDEFKDLSISISNGGPLFHLPITIEGEPLDEKLLNKLAFANEKLTELNILRELLNKNKEEKAKKWIEGIYVSFGEIKEVKEKIKNLKEEDFIRTPSFEERNKIQRELLKLPLFPTTTIGSFPQTQEVRKIRALYRQGKLSKEDYETFIRGEIAKCIQIQDELGLDVLVHGEFERTDMVEFFAEKLEGIATTKNGWIISYGTRGYRPPIIYGDIKRPVPMTIKEIAFAQKLTNKPVKGMLTGPVTIIAWSFVREDISNEEVAYQLALALQEEILDYEKAGIKIVQIDEPAIREKAPIKKRDWDKYFKWAVRAFRLCHSKVKPETQIHTHMCYSDFGEIINYILEMDFDVISIEAARSKGEIIKDFEKVNFDREIGLGVWDIHSPVVPSVEDMKKIVERALRVIPKEKFWINPDCGLKTRQWQEVIPALRNLVKLALILREEYK